MAALTAEDYLGLSVVAAIVSTAGSMLGVVLKERFLSRSFETWKTKQTYENARKRYRDPLALSALEFASRLQEILEPAGAEYLSEQVLNSTPAKSTRSSAQDEHYWRYKLVSSAYRMCALLGWLELLRRDVVYLTDTRRESSAAEVAIANIRLDLAEGRLNTDSEWYEWADGLIFREEQRAIADQMIVNGPTGNVVMGYAEFSDAFDDAQSSRHRWLRRAAEFLLDVASIRDFRYTRLQRLLVHSVDLAHALDPERVGKRLLELRASHRPAIEIKTDGTLHRFEDALNQRRSVPVA